MDKKIVVRIVSEESIEKFKWLAETNGWYDKYLPYEMYRRLVVKDNHIGINLSNLPSLSWDFIDQYETYEFHIITIQEALDMFDVWVPEKGDKVLALDSRTNEWVLVTFIAEHNNVYVCDCDGKIYIFSDIKEYQEPKIVTLSKNDQFFTLELTQDQFDKTIEFMKGLIRK